MKDHQETEAERLAEAKKREVEEIERFNQAIRNRLGPLSTEDQPKEEKP